MLNATNWVEATNNNVCEMEELYVREYTTVRIQNSTVAMQINKAIRLRCTYLHMANGFRLNTSVPEIEL